jgi:sensor histidine kinase YesM
LLTIRAQREGNYLVLEIQDNGIGREEAKRSGSEGTGMGLQIMQEFLELYQKITGIRIQWQVMDLFDEACNAKGIKVLVTIPMQ